MFNPNDLDLDFQRSIPGNKTSAAPSNWLFFDVETKEEITNDFKELHFRMAWIRALRLSPDLSISREKYSFWQSPEDLWKYVISLCRKKAVLYVCAHNIYFDLQASEFFFLLDRWGWELKFCYEKGSSFILALQKGDHKIKFISSTNYFAFSLEELGKLLDLPKLDIDFDKADPDSLSTYCHRDVEILSASMLQYMRFVKDHEAGRFAVTRASQSSNWYRHSFMKKKIYIHDYEMVKELERLCYYGGRTECFYIGKVPYSDIVFLDVNSMYPSVMKEYSYPTKLIGYHEEDCEAYYDSYSDRACFCAEAEIQTDQPAYALRHEGKNVFPIGHFTTYLCTEGLRYASEHGHLKGISKLAIFTREWIFDAFVDELFALRMKYKKEGNKIYEHTIKIMMNSLYGKFGMRISDELIEPSTSESRFSTETITNMYTGQFMTKRIMFGKELIDGEQKDGRYTFTAIAAHVTEYARFTLWDLLSRLGRERVFYCDTDSLAIRQTDLKHFDSLICDQRLGALGIDKTCSEFIIHGLKDYSLDGIRKTKGVPKNATQTGLNEYRYDSFLKLRSHLHYQEARHYLLRPTTKSISDEYTKGTVQADGHIVPLRF